MKVVKKFTERVWLQGWVRSMNKTIGKTSEILELGKTDKNSCLLCVDGDKWWYPSESLELVEEVKQEENQRFNNVWDALGIFPDKDISYQEFLDAFDYDDSPYIEINKEQVVIGVVDNRLECTTKQREQEVMKALIMLYGKREGENRWHILDFR